MDALFEKEFDRQQAQIRDLPLPSGSIYLQPRDVLKAHFEIASYFSAIGEGIGGLGVKDPRLLESAVARQDTSFGGVFKWKRHLDIISSLFFGIIKNHPFYDANKRTALLCCLYQLERISRVPKVREKELEDFTVDVAEDQLAKHDRERYFHKHPCDIAYVLVISDFLQKSTRKAKDEQRLITYRQLNTLLHKYGFEIRDKGGNHADVVRIADGQKLRGIGFPGMSVEVSRGDLKRIRDATGLTKRYGIDDAVFFEGLENHQALIEKYNVALRSLAGR